MCVCVWVCGYPKVGVAENHNINDDLYANNVSLPWFSHSIHEYMTNSGSDVCVCLYRCDNFHLEYYKILIHKHEYSKCVYEYARANSRWLYLNINIFNAFQCVSVSKEPFLRHFSLIFTNFIQNRDSKWEKHRQITSKFLYSFDQHFRFFFKLLNFLLVHNFENFIFSYFF